MKINKKRIIAIFLVILSSLILSFNILGCKADFFTEEQHIKRIRERIDKKIDEWNRDFGSNYTGFEVYPLYNQYEELEFFLVEFEPCGFTFILAVDEKLSCLSWFGASTSMYTRSGIYGDRSPWSPYTINPDSTSSSDNKNWILDENGEKINYSRSPYYVSGNINERKYILRTNSLSSCICAVKKGDSFLNLICNMYIPDLDTETLNNQPTFHIYFINKGQFNI